MTTWVGVAAVVTIAAIAVFATRRYRSGPIVLGQQVADARANEAARLASGRVGSSPMPAGEYDNEVGDDDLAYVSERPLDLELQALVRAFKTWSPDTRAESRRGISMDEQYTLIHFAKRSSVLALQERSATRCEDGLLALAMIDETRIDPRDGAWATALLAHAIDAATADRQHLVNEAAALATPGMARILMQATQGSQLSAWGYTQIQTENGGVGLVPSGFARYEPTFDMSRLALRLAAHLRRGRYIAEPELASEVPTVWFAKAHRANAAQLLEKAHGAISVHGTLRKAYTDKPFAQLFTQWVVEMPSAEDADALVTQVDVNTRIDGRFILGVVTGRLFSLLMAGSCMEGVEPFESPESLGAMVEETRPLLQEAAREI